MLIRRAYKFLLKPTARQAEQCSRFAGCCRLVWNKALSAQNGRLDQNEIVQSYVETAAALVLWKTEMSFLREAHSQPLQQALKDLDRALKDAFKKRKDFQSSRRRGKVMVFGSRKA